MKNISMIQIFFTTVQISVVTFIVLIASARFFIIKNIRNIYDSDEKITSLLNKLITSIENSFMGTVMFSSAILFIFALIDLILI